MYAKRQKLTRQVACAPIIAMQEGKGVFLAPSLQPALHHPGGVGGGHRYHVSSLLRGGVSRGERGLWQGACLLLPYQPPQNSYI